MGVEEQLPTGVLLTSVENIFGYMRSASFWPATFGLACCAIEMMTYGAPRYDSGRWGQEVFRASPRQADLMIVAGRVSQKMAPVLRQIYDQMPNPKWVLAMGVCASTGGMFNNYAIVQGVDHVVPVDMYLPGCPPRPEMLIDAMFKLRDKVRQHPDRPPRRRGCRAGRAGRARGAGEHRADGSAAVSDHDAQGLRNAQAERRRRPSASSASPTPTPRSRARSPRASQRRTPAPTPARRRARRPPVSTASTDAAEDRAETDAGGRRRRRDRDRRARVRGAARPARHVRRQGQRRHLRLRRPVARHRLPGRRAAAVRRVVGRGVRPDGRPGPEQHVGRHREGRRAPRRDHLPRGPLPAADAGAPPARRPAPALRALQQRVRRALPGRRRPRAARGLPPAVDDLQPADPARGQRPRRRPAHPLGRRDLPGRGLARARDVRHVRDRLRRPSRSDAHPDARRLARVTRSARTTRSAASTWSTTARPSRRRTSAGATPDEHHHHRPVRRGQGAVRPVARPRARRGPVPGGSVRRSGRGRGARLHRHRPGLGHDRRRPGRARRRAHRRQHGPAAPVHARRAPPDPRDGG